MCLIPGTLLVRLRAAITNHDVHKQSHPHQHNKNMVHTRSGRAVIHVEASYGRAANKELKRQMQKRKLNRKVALSATRRALSSQDSLLNLSSTPTRRTTRAQIQEALDVATPPSAYQAAAPATPPPTCNRLLCGRLPQCSDFGVFRHFAFRGQGLFFCSPCDLWDARLPDCSNEISRDSRRYACAAGHSFFSHPTSMHKPSTPLTKSKKLLSTTVSDDEEIEQEDEDYDGSSFHHHDHHQQEQPSESSNANDAATTITDVATYNDEEEQKVTEAENTSNDTA